MSWHLNSLIFEPFWDLHKINGRISGNFFNFVSHFWLWNTYVLAIRQNEEYLGMRAITRQNEEFLGWIWLFEGVYVRILAWFSNYEPKITALWGILRAQIMSLNYCVTKLLRKKWVEILRVTKNSCIWGF